MEGPEILSPPFNSNQRHLSLYGAIKAFIASMIGGSLLAYPFIIRATGVYYGVILLFVCMCTMMFSIYTLTLSSRLCGQVEFYEISQRLYGKKLKTFVACLVTLACMLSIVAFLILSNDVFHSIFQHYWNQNLPTWFSSVIKLVTLSATFPFFFMPSLHSLRHLHTFSNISLGILILVLGYRSYQSFNTTHSVSVLCAHDLKNQTVEVSPPTSWSSPWNLFLDSSTAHLSGFLVALPMSTSGFVCHSNALRIHSELYNPTRKRFLICVVVSFGIAFFIYLGFGLLGYFYALDVTCSNILLNLHPDDPLATAAKLLLSLIIIGSIPMQMLPGRKAFLTLLRNRPHLFRKLLSRKALTTAIAMNATAKGDVVGMATAMAILIERRTDALGCHCEEETHHGVNEQEEDGFAGFASGLYRSEETTPHPIFATDQVALQSRAFYLPNPNISSTVPAGEGQVLEATQHTHLIAHPQSVAAKALSALRDPHLSSSSSSAENKINISTSVLAKLFTSSKADKIPQNPIAKTPEFGILPTPFAIKCDCREKDFPVPCTMTCCQHSEKAAEDSRSLTSPLLPPPLPRLTSSATHSSKNHQTSLTNVTTLVDFGFDGASSSKQAVPNVSKKMESEILAPLENLIQNQMPNLQNISTLLDSKSLHQLPQQRIPSNLHQSSHFFQLAQPVNNSQNGLAATGGRDFDNTNRKAGVDGGDEEEKAAELDEPDDEISQQSPLRANGTHANKAVSYVSRLIHLPRLTASVHTLLADPNQSVNTAAVDSSAVSVDVACVIMDVLDTYDPSFLIKTRWLLCTNVFLSSIVGLLSIYITSIVTIYSFAGAIVSCMTTLILPSLFYLSVTQKQFVEEQIEFQNAVEEIFKSSSPIQEGKVEQQTLAATSAILPQSSNIYNNNILVKKFSYLPYTRESSAASNFNQGVILPPSLSHSHQSSAPKVLRSRSGMLVIQPIHPSSTGENHAHELLVNHPSAKPEDAPLLSSYSYLPPSLQGSSWELVPPSQFIYSALPSSARRVFPSLDVSSRLPTIFERGSKQKSDQGQESAPSQPLNESSQTVIVHDHSNLPSLESSTARQDLESKTFKESITHAHLSPDFLMNDVPVDLRTRHKSSHVIVIRLRQLLCLLLLALSPFMSLVGLYKAFQSLSQPSCPPSGPLGANDFHVLQQSLSSMRESFNNWMSPASREEYFPVVTGSDD